ncbi:ribosomal protein L4 [Pleomassaria siparia CBS 279.74]|uniref:Large ribosomal subunit protein uL4m n=1 Tax=Pleomassaria siparia CBS 279.74 TaxID=1314801 RepID=A0A6G1KBB1_9PLEO|nr:ribosomal protein L4 [Pleomassaria siparia CBS 279.74]
MASTRISAPVRGVKLQLSRLSTRQDVVPKCITSSIARPISTTTSSRASVSSIITSASAPSSPIKPLQEQTVLATIHHFPSLEPLRFESYPANHLYLPTRRDILHRAVIYEGDMTRLGTASTKTRYEVRGSAKKIRPQKGSGRARLGDKKSPMLRGGGVAFGPKPRDFSSGLQKKVYDLAWRTALSYRYRKGELVIVDNAMEIESPSPKLLNDIFESHPWGNSSGRSLLITLEQRPLLERALDAMGRSRQSLTWDEVDVKDLLELSRIVIERDALKNILLMHQEDLTHTSLPWYKGMVESSPPTSLEAITGWPEFRDLMSVPAVERDSHRTTLYQSVASQRWQEAASLPDDHPQKALLAVSSLELGAQSKNISVALQKSGRSTRSNVLSAHKRMLLKAEATEMRVQALRLLGKEEEANALWREAGDIRTDVGIAEADMCMLKGNQFVRIANDFTQKEMYEESEKAERQAEEWFARAEAANEGEELLEEFEEEDATSEELQELDVVEASIEKKDAVEEKDGEIETTSRSDAGEKASQAAAIPDTAPTDKDINTTEKAYEETKMVEKKETRERADGKASTKKKDRKGT